MKRNWKKYLVNGFVLSASTLLLAACGGSNDDTNDSAAAPAGSGDSATEDVKIEGDVKLWVDTDHISTYKEILEGFSEEYPDVNVTVSAGSSADAQKDLSKDPSAAADVFMMPHDQVGQMASAGLLYPIDKDADTIKENNVDSAVEGVTWDGDIYGYPYGVEAQVLYYNKSVLSEEDVKSWDTLTEKGVIGTNIAEAGANYIFGPLFMSNGLHLYGEDGEDPNGTDFNNEKGVEVLQWIAAQKDNSGVLQASESALSDLSSGKSSAFLSGPWSKNDVKDALGDDMAVAPYPTVDFGDGAVQMKAFLGVKVFGINQQTQNPLAAMALANYITNEDSQLLEFQQQGVVPSNAVLQDNEEVLADDTANAVAQMSQPENSVVMPKIPEIVSFWPPMDAIINDTYKGNIKEAEFQSKLDKLVEDTAQEPEE
ncbi:MAG TPA: extracellular solute-binding protein [Candidatus Tetragenococcus pullicola]|nr:extracellular solute-binding protein [Candidatus Tetragenococcus pullicola]